MPPKRKAKAKPKVKYIDQIVQTEETKQVKITKILWHVINVITKYQCRTRFK